MEETEAMQIVMNNGLLLIKVLPGAKTGAAHLALNAIPFEVVLPDVWPGNHGPGRRGWLRPEAQKFQNMIDTVVIGPYVGNVVKTEDVLAWLRD